MNKGCVALVLMLGVVACTKSPSPPASTLSLAQILGGSDMAGFVRAEMPRNFSFPQDHGAHPEFRNEWWYFTGNIESSDGRRFGYQVTFFNARINPKFNEELQTVTHTEQSANISAWASDRIWMAHVALTDINGHKHQSVERFARENPGLAGVQLAPFKVWLEDWQVHSTSGSADFPWQLKIEASDFAFHFHLMASKPPVLQGEQGLSRKNNELGNASYYYSMTRLATRGELRIGEERIAIRGDSWLDREWSTSALGAKQTGWDWFSLQFNDDQELMYYHLRSIDGSADVFSQGNWTNTNAQQTLISPGDIQLEPLAQWIAPNGLAYDTRWRVRYAGRRLIIEALLQDQYMNLSIPYWEGAVRVLEETSGVEIGKGYLEMVRE